MIGSALFSYASPALIATNPHDQALPERTLILGWNWRGPSIARELDHYVAPGSELLVAAGLDAIEEEVQALSQGLSNQSVRALKGDTSDRVFLEQLDLKNFNHVIVLSYLDTMTEQRADSSTLITLLHLRDMATLLSIRALLLKWGFEELRTCERVDNRVRRH